MLHRKRIGPRPGEGTLLDTTPTVRAASPIPHDLMLEAARRIGVMSLAGAGLWIAASIIYHTNVLKDQQGVEGLVAAIDIISGVSAALSLALFWYTRGSKRSPRIILALGRGYLVQTALALSFIVHWDPMLMHVPLFPMISWSGVAILMFAGIVPSAPATTLAVGIVAASMNPIAMLIARSRGVWTFEPWAAVFVMHYPDYLLAGVGAAISHVMTRLGRQVSKAREMGSYELMELLGKGGMGEVWRARHRMVAREAAIKLVQPDLLRRADSSKADMMQSRFQQEAKATAQLRSPHTVELYDYGVTEDGVFYYVMELLDGIDLETLVKQHGPLTAPRAIAILRQVCRSLDDAHAQGLIHRDVKPTNIFVCRMGNEYDYVKVLDFGLVKATHDDPKLTGVGAPMGTPAFMAPEMVSGAAIDARCDLYGLGCVAYWLVTGRMVFDEPTPTAMVVAHMEKRPVPPSERVGAEIPPDLEQTILQCLAKDPGDRPPTAAALGSMLDGCMDARSWSWGDAELWWKSLRIVKS